jgi:hypothetical protein
MVRAMILPLLALLVPLHLGSLHPVEKVLTLVLAFGPFVVLGVVIVLRRRQDRREDEAAADADADAEAKRAQRDR